MSTPITATYVDTCLPCYLQDGCNRPGQTLCLASLGEDLADTVESLWDSIDWDAGIPEDISDVAICRALRSALDGVDLRAIDGEGNRINVAQCDEHNPEGEDDFDTYLYVSLSW